MRPIGIFDSGYGGLTVFRNIRDALPEYDYIYLGDNARAPYGNRSFDTIHAYTWEAVQWMFAQGCPLIILACNTASAKALRTIQQKNLPNKFPDKRVLGVIRPTAEIIGQFSKSGHVGVLGTSGTVNSNSYPLEIEKFFPSLSVYQQACPLWVPLVEAGEENSAAADLLVEENLTQLLQQARDIDTVLLACTHYPLLAATIAKHLPDSIQMVGQGQIVAESLKDYLSRHPEIAKQITQTKTVQFFTTDNAADFEEKGARFLGQSIRAKQIVLTSE
ncbi:MAG: glutamate racemase [Bacteroidetes bacterium]|nr:glutamate racemase [Bacteroidota bacterium]